MLQFSYNQNTNSNAIWPDYTASANLSQVILDFTSSYDKSVLTGSIADVLNTTGLGNPWLVFSLSGSRVPTPSGQYDVNIWEFSQVAGGLGIWIEQNTLFGATNETWNTGPGGTVRTNLLSTERAYVSGSNESSIDRYLSPYDGYYYTYNG
jgi:hypothetical protein